MGSCGFVSKGTRILLTCVCASVCMRVCVGEKKSLRIVFANGKVAVTVCVQTFVYVWVWRAVLAHTDLCQEEDVFLN